MEPDKPQEPNAGDAEAPTKDGVAQKAPTASTDYEQPASSGGISPVVWVLLALIVIGLASKFLNPAAKPNDSEMKQRGSFAPYVQGSPSQPGN